MDKIHIIPLPYSKDLSIYVSNIAEYPWSIWLDSGTNNHCHTETFNTSNRFDIVSAWPNKTITSYNKNSIVQDITYNNKFLIVNKTFSRISNKKIDPIELLTQHLNLLQSNDYNETPKDCITPFWYGALGYFSYDLNQLLYKKIKIHNPSNIPLMAIGIYSWALISDHQLKKTYIAWDNRFTKKSTINSIYSLLTQTNNELNNAKKNKMLHEYFSENIFFTPHTEQQEYKNNFNKIKSNIYNGNCYQINYSIKFAARFKPDKHINTNISTWDLYKYLRNLNSNPFSCYFNLSNNLQILSFSPERFLKIHNNRVITQPIKGTRKNHPNVNSININDLVTNPKDRAENVMITDLMRNDLNKFCIPGTVKTPELCKLYTFPTVHHLISTVEGYLKPGIHSLNLFKGCFPGGSITGAPKIKAMEIIQELENKNLNSHRNIYCGSIGYININNNLDTSITIRTLLHYNNTYYYWAGSGIVADSNYEDEYNEIFYKIIKTY